MTMHYTDWTARQVKEWIVEAASTTSMLSGRYGPRKFGNGMPEVVREKWKDAAPMATPSRSIPSSHALDRMEAVWAWINALPSEADRRLLYEWAEAKALGRGNLAAVISRSEYAERTYRMLVTRLCQRIADNLNQVYEVRLTVRVDEIAAIGDPVRDFTVRSGSYGPRTPKAWMATDAKPHHNEDTDSCQSEGKYLAGVNKRRQNQARRAAERKAKREAKAAKRKQKAAA